MKTWPPRNLLTTLYARIERILGVPDRLVREPSRPAWNEASCYHPPEGRWNNLRLGIGKTHQAQSQMTAIHVVAHRCVEDTPMRGVELRGILIGETREVFLRKYDWVTHSVQGRYLQSEVAMEAHYVWSRFTEYPSLLTLSRRVSEREAPLLVDIPLDAVGITKLLQMRGGVDTLVAPLRKIVGQNLIVEVRDPRVAEILGFAETGRLVRLHVGRLAPAVFESPFVQRHLIPDVATAMETGVMNMMIEVPQYRWYLQRFLGSDWLLRWGPKVLSPYVVLATIGGGLFAAASYYRKEDKRKVSL